MATLTETYRPSTWSEVVGQDKAIGKLRAIGRNGFGGRAIWITGASGTGKTTLARIVAAEVASDWATIEVDAGEGESAKDRRWRFAGNGLDRGGSPPTRMKNNEHEPRINTGNVDTQ